MKAEQLPSLPLEEPSFPCTDARLTPRTAWQEAMGADHGTEPGDPQFENVKKPRGMAVIDAMNTMDVAYDALMQLATRDTTPEGEAVLGRVQSLKTVNKGMPPPDKNPFLETWEANLVDDRPAILADPVIQEYLEKRDLSDAHTQLVEAWPKACRIVTEGVRRGIAEGYIPADVMQRLDDALQRTTVRVVDEAILSYYASASAYYQNTTDEIGLVHDTKSEENFYVENSVHELLHKLSGGTFWEGKTDSDATEPKHTETKHYRPRVGFATMQGSGKAQTREGLNEAVTQHMTAAFMSGDFETLDPDQRTDGNNIYYGYRKVLAALVERSGGQIDQKMVMNAYFEDTGAEGAITARMQFIRGIYKAYGSGALRKIDELMRSSETCLNVGELEERVLQCIVPPQTNSFSTSPHLPQRVQLPRNNTRALSQSSP